MTQHITAPARAALFILVAACNEAPSADPTVNTTGVRSGGDSSEGGGAIVGGGAEAGQTGASALVGSSIAAGPTSTAATASGSADAGQPNAAATVTGSNDAGQPSAAAAMDGGYGASSSSDGGTIANPTVAEDFEAKATDFACLKNWTKVRSFRIANGLGKLDAALAVANSPDGGVYPVGTILQLVPTEAMVKRGAGFSPETRDWEFFALTVSAQGTRITARGKGEVVNQFGLQCFACHAKAAPQFDLVCETTHGCDPLPLPTSLLESLQDTDSRCQ